MADNSHRGEICLAELLTALHELEWKTEEQAMAIFHALGFNWKNSKPATIAKHYQNEAFDRNRYRAKPLVANKTFKDSSTISAPPPPQLPVELPKTILNSNINSIATEQDLPQASPDWLNEDGFAVLKQSSQTEKPLRESLFPNLTQRGILSAALTVKNTGRDIDTHLLIDQVIKGRIPRTLPTNIQGSLDYGCQLFLDYSDSMTPFWEDLSTLAEQVENLIGAERLKVFEFDQDPIAAEHWFSSRQMKPWKPEINRPIIAATNLNITGQQRQTLISKEWLAFIQQCEQTHIPLMLLVPWRESYWPTGIGNHPLLIHWNPATTAAMVFSLVGKGHETNR